MAMSSDLNWDPAAVTSLQAKLLDTKLATDADTFFPAQAFARGGIGALVSTGSARGGINRLPQKARRSAGASQGTASFNCSRPGSTLSGRTTDPVRPGTTGTGVSSGKWSGSSRQWWGGLPGSGDTASLAAAAAASVVLGPDATGVPTVAKHAWEHGVQHAYNFVSTTRQTRTTDVRSASKWATLSLYETDPKEVKRHLDIVNFIDQAHCGEKVLERDTERVRHFTWAMQQREVFRRQRQEVAVRYAQAGLRPRKAYSAVASSRAAGFGATTDPAGSSELQRGASGSLTGTPRPGTSSTARVTYSPPFQTVPVINMPKPTYTNVYQRMATEADDLLENSVEAARRRVEEAAQRKTETELKGQLVDMDNFEQHLQGILRRQVRGRTAEAEPSTPGVAEHLED